MKGKAQYSWAPCTKGFRSATINSGNIIYFFTKESTVMRRSTVQSLSPKLVFLGKSFIELTPDCRTTSAMADKHPAPPRLSFIKLFFRHHWCLECLSLRYFFPANLQEPTLIVGNVNSLSLIAEFRFVWKNLTVSNTLAYSVVVSVARKKVFRTITPSVSFNKLFS